MLSGAYLIPAAAVLVFNSVFLTDSYFIPIIRLQDRALFQKGRKFAKLLLIFIKYPDNIFFKNWGEIVPVKLSFIIISVYFLPLSSLYGFSALLSQTSPPSLVVEEPMSHLSTALKLATSPRWWSFCF